MKKLLLVTLALALAGANLCYSQEKPQRGSAEYYLQDPDRYLNKPLTLYVLMATRADEPAPENYESFWARTSGNNTYTRGGTILVYVRKSKAKAFEKKHREGWILNGKPQVTAVSGKLVESQDGTSFAVLMN